MYQIVCGTFLATVVSFNVAAGMLDIVDMFPYFDAVDPLHSIGIMTTDDGGYIIYSDEVVSDFVRSDGKQASYAIGKELGIAIYLPPEEVTVGDRWEFSGCAFNVVSRHPYYMDNHTDHYLKSIRAVCDEMPGVSYFLYSDLLGVQAISVGSEVSSDGVVSFSAQYTYVLTGYRVGFGNNGVLGEK
ncbi:hypothetical protein [Gimibacter soli]|uniref:Uncharacterized protein n=1 Tax=Gimibacter soli TaxID=3024400 RepID=A0AAE9XNW5_9PROT|nr:hypothetical protein [Gimibacter soli]WCL53621.1 hypothetical protein PH603_13865 [Gimibacter soli]